MLREMPATYMQKKVATTDTGIDTATMSVFFTERRKKKSTITARMPPYRAVSSTSRTDCRM